MNFLKYNMNYKKSYCNKGHRFTSNSSIYRIKKYNGEERLYRECRICHNIKNRRYENNRFKTKEKHYMYKMYGHIKRTYNLSEENYKILLESQDYRCGICNRHISELKTSLCVDHNHETNEIRGLLCRKCNGSLGWYEIYRESIMNYLLTIKNVAV